MKIDRYIQLVTIFVFLPFIGYAQKAPELILPENGATGLSTTLTFEWSEVSDADTYQIEIAETSNFDDPVFQDKTSSTSIQVSGLSMDKTYHWHVRAGQTILTIVQYGDWSNTWTFTTAPPVPDIPELVSPKNGTGNHSTNPAVTWNSTEYAETYRIQVSETNDFSTTVRDLDSLNTTELQISGLHNGTTYYWRVNASNESGSSDWSTVWSFTTVTEPPAAPNLIGPENGATHVSTTATLEWESPENADHYDFQIALDEGFNNKIVDQTNVTSTSYQGNFDGYTIYFWRVRAENQGGDSEWSEPWSFTTEPDENVLSILAPSKKELLKGSQNYNIRWKSTNKINEVTLEYSTNTGETWTVIDDAVDASSGTNSWTIPDTSSVNARIKITDNDNPDFYSISEPFLLYPYNLKLKHRYSFGSANSPSDYKLIGLPAMDGITVDEIFSGRPGTDWNAYYDNGNEENYLVPYDSTEVFTLQPGRAFWAISKSDAQISVTSASVELAPDTTFSIPLHPGWNLISNPFANSIQWAEVQSKNNLEDPLWAFDGSYSESESLNIYQGYYFYNRNNLEELLIPYYTDATNPSDQQEKRLKDREFITLKLLANGESVSSIDAGIKTQFSDHSNPEFDFAPPGDFQNYKITIGSEGLAPGNPEFTRLIQPNSTEPYSFDVSIKSPAGKPIEIKAEGLSNFSSYDVVLVDKKSSKSYNLHQNSDLRMNSYEELKDYTLIIGNSKSVPGKVNAEEPQQTLLFQNYPNPFNNQTTIEYSIDQNMANSHVLLEIYNIIGQRIAQLVNERQPAGFYQVNWNTENNPGQELASGLYFYRLQIDNNLVKTRQLTLLK